MAESKWRAKAFLFLSLILSISLLRDSKVMDIFKNILTEKK